MAIWQYTFQVLPIEKEEVIIEKQNLNEKIILPDYDFIWEKRPSKRNRFDEIGSVLLKNKSWSSEIDLYGNLESNCFEVYFDVDNFVTSVSFRIDFRSNYENILKKIIKFLSYNNLNILDEQLNYVPLDYEYIKSTINNSSQVKKYYELSK